MGKWVDKSYHQGTREQLKVQSNTRHFGSRGKSRKKHKHCGYFFMIRGGEDNAGGGGALRRRGLTD